MPETVVPDSQKSPRPPDGAQGPAPAGPVRETDGSVILELQDVSKRYESQGAVEGPLVLSGVDLTVAAGDSLAIVGPSGSGKSTLLNLAPGMAAAPRKPRIAPADCWSAWASASGWAIGPVSSAAASASAWPWSAR